MPDEVTGVWTAGDAVQLALWGALTAQECHAADFYCIELQPYWRGVSIAQDGNPAPSLRVLACSGYPFRLAVKAGAHTVSADVLQPQASAIRPRLRVRANPAIGLASDLEAVAGPATGWQTVSANFTATANGGVRVELVNTDAAWPCWFDNVRVT